MEDSSWGLIIIVIIILLLIIVLTGVIFFRSINKDPDDTVSSIGNKCSSTVPCSKGFECSKFFCQNSGITTGETGAFCLPNGQFPTTSGSSSPGCNSSAGLNCVANVCVRTKAGLVLGYDSNQSQNLTVTVSNSENQRNYLSDDATIISEPFRVTGQNQGINITDGMSIGRPTNQINYPVQNSQQTGIRFGPIPSRQNSIRYSRRNESGRSNQDSKRHDSIRFSGRSSSRRDGRYDSEGSGRYDSTGSSGRYESDRNNQNSSSWGVNQRGDVNHYNHKNREWECIFPSGFSWLVGRRTSQLTAKCMTVLKSDSGDKNVVVSFRSANSEFSHSLFYEIVTNQGPGRPYILIPWTTYQNGEFNGRIFCPTQEVNYEEDSTSRPEWVPIVGSKIELQEDGKLWIQGHIVGSDYPRLFIPSSTDQSKEYLARDGQLY